MSWREINRFATVLLLPLMAGGQEVPTPTVTLTSNSTTLQLPGTLTLTARVDPPAGSGAMPSGSIAFASDTSTALGSATLSPIPSTQSFLTSSPTISTFPTAAVAYDSSAFGHSVLATSANVFDTTSGNYYPDITVFTGQGGSLLSASTSYQLSSATNTPGGITDGIATGDFNHDGIPDLLLHTSDFNTNSSSYLVLTGKADGSFNANTITSTDNSGYLPSGATMAFTVDDFNGDGYSDVAYAISSGTIGVSLNPGANAPGAFQTFTSLSAVAVPTGDSYVPQALTTGHTTSSGNADLIVFGQIDNGGTVVEEAIALFLGNGNGTFSGPSTINVKSLVDSSYGGFEAMSVAKGDLRKSGSMDVVVADDYYDTTLAQYTGTVEVLFTDGKGNLSLNSTITPTEAPEQVSVADFDGDGYPDLLVTGIDGSIFLYINDGTGNFPSAATVISTPGLFLPASEIGDFNADGLPDILELDLGSGDPNEFLNSASSQATFVTPQQSLPAGNHTLTATVAANTNFATATSAGLAVSVTQSPTTITWSPPAPIEYGTALGSGQLDAVGSVPGSISYSPAAGTVLPPGQTVVTATLAPTDSFDYMASTATRTIAVSAPSLTSIAPTSASLGGANTTITVNGQGLVNGAVVKWNTTPLATTWVSLNQLTAVVPASLLSAVGTATITVADPNNVSVGGSEVFTINAAQAVAQANVPATVDAGQNSSVSLTLSPYPVEVTATLTLSFTPAPPNTVADPTVLFANNSTTYSFTIPANNSSPIPAIDFSSGSTAGNITLTIQLIADGVNITPASFGPFNIAVPATPPGITSVVVTRNGTAMSVAILGFSSTRDMSQATFHFTPAAGKSLTTTDLTVSLTSPFVSYYQSAQSDAAGSSFLYTQPFTLSTDATSVGTVTVTLSNSQGVSQPVSAQ